MFYLQLNIDECVYCVIEERVLGKYSIGCMCLCNYGRGVIMWDGEQSKIFIEVHYFFNSFWIEPVSFFSHNFSTFGEYSLTRNR